MSRGRKKINWLPEHECLLGTMPDLKLANIIGVSDTSVSKRRAELGIKPYKLPNSKSQKFSEFLRLELKKLEITQSDAAILFDVSQSMIEAWLSGPDKLGGKTPSKLEIAGIFSILRNQRHRKNKNPVSNF